MSGNDPGAIASTHRHNSLGGIDKLVAIMKMQRDHVSRGIVVREGGNLGVTVGQRFENCTWRFCDIHCHDIGSTNSPQSLSWAYLKSVVGNA